MKVASIILILLASFVTDVNLPVNEEGKIIFEDVVVVENMSKDVLFINAINYGERVKKASERKTSMYANPREGVVSKEGSFYVYTDGLFTPQIHGEIKFTVRLEVDQNKYKYRYTDFVFQHYSKNRYGQYAPVSGKVKPLEEEKYAGMQKTWEQHKKLTREHIENHIRELKIQMQEIPTKAASGDWEHLIEETNN